MIRELNCLHNFITETDVIKKIQEIMKEEVVDDIEPDEPPTVWSEKEVKILNEFCETYPILRKSHPRDQKKRDKLLTTELPKELQHFSSKDNQDCQIMLPEYQVIK
jgi:hypothetical protein